AQDGDIGPNDQPFLGLAIGHNNADAASPWYKTAVGINHTLLAQDPRPAAQRALLNQLLFEPDFKDPSIPADVKSHPYVRHELMTKIFNNVTTRSNVFAVWLTVGYFEVSDDTTRPVKLGPEVLVNGSPIRNQMFAIVDRTNLHIASPSDRLTQANTVIFDDPTGPTGPLPGLKTVTIPPAQPGQVTMAGTTTNGMAWRITKGTPLIVDSGTLKETVTVIDATDTSFRAIFPKPHSANVNPPFTPAFYRITIPGNPGPQREWFTWTSAAYSDVVLYAT